MALKSKPLDEVRADVPLAEVIDARKPPGGHERLVQINIVVPASMRTELKVLALHEDRYLNDILVDAIKLYQATKSQI